MASFIFHAATAEDAPAIAALMDAVWQSNVEPSLIASILSLSNHSTHLVYHDNSPAAFVDSFLTISATGVPRWEVDLLAVHPAYRRQGLAPELIHVSLATGREHGAEQARALVAFGNRPAEQSFTRCGFQPDSHSSHLYVSNGGEYSVDMPSFNNSAHFHPVQTFSYTGVWIEEKFMQADLKAAKAIISGYGWTTAGAVIPAISPTSLAAAQAEAYSFIGEYRNWMRTLK